MADEPDKPIPETLLGSIPPTDPEHLRLMQEIRETAGHYSAIGRVTATWSEFEHEIQLIIWRIAGIDYQMGACITSQIGGSGRMLDCLIAIMGLKGAPESQLRALRSFAEKAGNKQRKRNRFIHDAWYFERDEKGRLLTLRMEISAAKTLVYEAFEENSTKLHNFANEISLLGAELQGIVWPTPLEP